MIGIQGNENDRIRAGVKGQPFGGAGLTVPNRLIDLSKRFHVTTIEQFIHTFFQ
jgi:hypothetical protein